MRFLYSIAMGCYGGGIALAGLWNAKARAWRKGRRGDYWERLEKYGREHPNSIWFHCASLGEFEQAQMVIAGMDPSLHPVTVTFSSPSGYNARKSTDLATGVFYLPLDLPGNARRFIRALQPRCGIFVKYEIWLHLIAAARKQGIPLALIAAQFQPQQIYFRLWGGAFVKALQSFQAIGVQDVSSLKLMERIGVTAEVTGDPRIDRVAMLPEEVFRDDLLESLTNRFTILGGSVWDPELDLLRNWRQKDTESRILIAPHELDERTLDNIQELIPDAIRRSECKAENPSTLILDQFGVLNKLYRYADVAVVGGGFKTGLHNILEPATYGIPVIFGPKHHRFPEAKQMIDAGGAFAVSNQSEFNVIMNALRDYPEKRKMAGDAALRFIQERRGAAQKNLDLITHCCGLSTE